MTLLQRYKRLNIWNKLGVIASIVGILVFILTVILLLIPKRPKLHPRFTVSLQIGDSSTVPVVLTNDCLFRAGMVNVITNFSNGSLLFNGIANGCVVIPAQPGESNKVFSFIAENDASVKVSDLEIAVGFPKEWELGLDSTKWHPVNEHLIVTGWKFEITNLQFWAAQSPWPLFPSDSVVFPPITNSSIPEFNSPSNKNGIFEVSVRSTDFESLISANVLFVRISSNSFKPFVTSLHSGIDGFWRVPMSPKELEDSQK